jgi:hypothetical protein
MSYPCVCLSTFYNAIIFQTVSLLLALNYYQGREEEMLI